MELSGKINSWAWVKHLKYVEKRRMTRHFGKKEKTVSELLQEGFRKEQDEEK